MKTPAILISVLLMAITACHPSSKEFVPNTDNPFMVGRWTITGVDDNGDLTSKQTLFLSLIEENYVEGNSLVFYPGDRFVVVSENGDTISRGRYGLSDHNDHLELFSPEDKKVTRYEISPSGQNVLQLNPVSAGDIRGLVITKSKED